MAVSNRVGKIGGTKHKNITGNETLPLSNTGSETLPLNTTPRPRHENMTGNDQIVNNNTAQCMNTQNDTAAACNTGNCISCTPKMNPGIDTSTLTVDQRLGLLETNVDRLNYRQSYQEHLHRSVREDGNITHYFNIIPTVLISAATGLAIGLTIHSIVFYFKNRKGNG